MLSFPPTALKKHRTAVDVALQNVIPELENGLRGLLIGGSVGSGQAHEFSDVDLFVLAELEWFQRRRLMIDGVAVDIFVDSARRVENQINFHNVIHIRNYATGWILWDPSSLVSRYKRAAQTILALPALGISSNTAKDTLSVRDLSAACSPFAPTTTGEFVRGFACNSSARTFTSTVDATQVGGAPGPSWCISAGGPGDTAS